MSCGVFEWPFFIDEVENKATLEDDAAAVVASLLGSDILSRIQWFADAMIKKLHVPQKPCIVKHYTYRAFAFRVFLDITT